MEEHLIEATEWRWRGQGARDQQGGGGGVAACLRDGAETPRRTPSNPGGQPKGPGHVGGGSVRDS